MEQRHSRRFDGLLVCSPDDSQLGELPESAPVVFLDSDPAHARGSVQRITVELDVAGGMRAAVEYLVVLGHRRIGHLRSTVSAHTFRSRQAAFAEASRGLEVVEVGVSLNEGLAAARAAARVASPPGHTAGGPSRTHTRGPPWVVLVVATEWSAGMLERPTGTPGDQRMFR